FHRRSSDTCPCLSGSALTALPFTATVACVSSRFVYVYSVPGTGWLRAHPGMRSLSVPLTSSLAEMVIFDAPPQGIPLCTDSASSFAPTVNDVSLDRYRLT